MRPIPKELLDTMLAKKFYQKCAVSGRRPVQLHHNLVYGGRQVNEEFAILPLHRDIHAQANEWRMREKLDWIMLNRATEEELDRYSKVVPLRARRDFLNAKFGVYAVQ